MSRKNVLTKYVLLGSIDSKGVALPVSMATDLASSAVDIQFLDNVCIQIDWTGNATGDFAIEGRIDSEMAWQEITLDPALPSPAGSAGGVLVDMNQLSFPQIRLTYTTTFVESGSITAKADVAGSLNNKYLLIDGADGDDWYIWFNVNSAGTDPALPNRTGVEVALATGATANTVGAAVRTALASVTSVDSIAGANAIATFDQSEAGHGALADGAAPTTFTLAYTATTGEVLAKISAKMI